MIEDSLNTKISGYAIGMGIGYGLANAKKTISIAGYLGFNTGRTTLSKMNTFLKKINSFLQKLQFNPKLLYNIYLFHLS
jgi:hypothetical protein